ncbi:glucose/galactose MFS transporter [Pelobium manganitolerans]|uniref:Glucose/galactose MFS transporter n=1 Tax=Pelobium manganitolerans TaxID=1842495 RepID=A0A419S7H2_9SPHI|nr:sugar MFS transporter [Pelobium manganitolerans]RKD17260.1 glucose/galactose MFS transporter [Pelobium manganitolerans]
MSTATTSPSQKGLNPVIIIGALFFVFGFVTWLNGTLIPFLQLACELTTSQALLVTFAFYMAYFFLAIPSSYILKLTGFKKGMAMGLFVMALGALIFLPAANLRNFPLFLLGLFVQGMGLALLQTASNPYITIVGPIESAAKRISIMGICNKIAGALSPLILSALVLKGAQAIEDQAKAITDPAQREVLLSALAQRVILPYIIIAAVLIILALLIIFSSLPEINTDEDHVDDTGAVVAPKASVFSYRNLNLGVICLFLYVGVEVMAGDVIGTYGKSLGMSLDQTKIFTSYTLVSMVVGYIIGIICIPKYIKQEKALMLSAIVGMLFTLAAYLTNGYTSIVFIALLGLANSLMWPAIFPLAIKGLGRYTKIGSALLVMGIAGGAIIPQVYAFFEHSMGSQSAFLVSMLPCYIYIFYYAISGHKTAVAR